MNYMDVMQSVNPLSALKALNIEATLQGAYVQFPCMKCQAKAVIKAYGDKKNVMYCPECKATGHIISLTMAKQNVEWEEAKKFLKNHVAAKKITRELEFEYDLVYHQSLRQRGLPEDFCKIHGIGYPKGKTMLAGCIAFTVSNAEGKKIAYYGKRIKDEKAVFHKSFNPELYLYNYHDIDPVQEVHFTTDIWKCLEIIGQGGAAVCNFGLPYLSPSHVDLLQKCNSVLYLKDQNFKEIMKQVTQMNNYFKFVA
ncbi:MAG TPA: hypothetical protein VHT73_15935 [Thermodesulfobacteriota bacterium]|nr:hypothetical protein [Thermodesulfobacteriota bacterium]